MMTERKRFIVQQVELSDGMNFEDAEIWEVVVDIDTDGMFFVGDINTANELCELLNKQEDRIQELEGITKRLDRLNNKLIQENTEQCKTCELAKIQHEQIQDLKATLSKIPDSVKKNWI